MISIVIPTYNESSTIETLLYNLFKVISNEDEVIVVDGDSEDDTVEKVKTIPEVKIIKSLERGRAVQMNRGAEESEKEYIFFLHADTLIDQEGIEKLKNEITTNKPNWGWFTLKLNSPKFIYRIIEIIARYRTRIAHEPLGDHGIFVRREIFEKIGGYPAIPLMEEVELVKKLKKISKGKRINHHVLSSVRRFEKGGIIKTTVNICLTRILYFLGTSSTKLNRNYTNIR